MKKIALISAFLLLTTAGMGWAFDFDNIYLDLQDYGLGQTGIFDTFRFTDSTQTVLNPDLSFSDSGNAMVTVLTNPDGDIISSAGMRTDILSQTGNYEITIDWAGLSGSLSNPTPGSDDAGGYIEYDVNYNPGVDFSFYIDTSVDANFGTSLIKFGDNSGFNDGQVELIARVTGGSGEALIYDTVKIEESSAFTYQEIARQNINIFYDIVGFSLVGDDTTTVFFDEYGNPISNYFDNGIIAFATEGADRLRQRLYLDGELAGTVQSQGQGSFGLRVVPEPSTMLLLGFGLLGFAGIGRRKFRT